MAFRAALISILVLASAVLLSSSYRKEDFKETQTLEDELLEAALSDTEAPTEINEEDEMALQPVNIGRWFRNLGDRIREGFRRIEPGLRRFGKGVERVWNHVKPYAVPWILKKVFS
ncbi:unnamed protein product [Dibothriocephalus latus]|uniref:Uncharacterized protein n=1 Tax=Dibothriocephalus latus TaxID=60516 RepID=A0A3P6PU61_DIBLA|nr:unnamed protein product [Dibothriocephalus latus]